MKKLYILNVGSTYDELKFKFGDFEQWAKDKIDDKIPTKTLHVKQDDFPNTNECLGVIVMGSHSMLSEKKDWMENAKDFLKECIKSQIPTLGICFGHQLLAYTLGGEIGYNKNGLEIGVARINLTQNGKSDRLFLGLNDEFKAYVSHFQSVLSLPKNVDILAFKSHEKIHAFRYGKNAYGVQFHPEFTKQIMQFYTKKHKDDLANNFQSIYKNITPCNQSHKIFDNFIEILSY